MSAEILERLNAALDGRYRVEREIGEGGMATVYLALDLRHDRKVALKVLRPEITTAVGAERFLSEIRTTAQLQHPNILPLFDSGEVDGFLFYAMPFVEGETLSARLEREQQLPVDEAVSIAREVVLALDHAHRRGVIHRDIKPGNILLAEGRAVVSDFGIALAVGSAGGSRLTETGLSLGTPHYMSPEQATGEGPFGAATDVYALGCVLYEMLAGSPPYSGSTVQAVLANIITGSAEPVSRLRPSVPANVDAALLRALEKLPADRFESAGAFGEALADASFRYGTMAPAGETQVRLWKRMAVGAGAVAIGAMAVATWATVRGPETAPEPPRPVSQLVFSLGEDQTLQYFRSFDVSPDGSFFVYQGPGDDAAGQLWRRDWSELEPVPVPGTAGGVSVRPAVSPDQTQVAVISGGITRASIDVVPLVGGGVRRTVVEDDDRPAGDLTWSPDGAWIYFSTEEGIARVAASGGPYERVTTVDGTSPVTGQGQIEFLPGGQKAVFVAWEDRWANPQIYSLDLESGETSELVSGLRPRYRDGYLIYGSQGAEDERTTLMAGPFDPETAEFTQPPIPVLEGISRGRYAHVYAALSQSGTLVYTRGGAGHREEPVWVDRGGQVEPIDPQWYFGGLNPSVGVALSPDDRRFAASSFSPGSNLDLAWYDIWVKDLETGALTRLTTSKGNFQPRWLSADSLLYWTRVEDGLQLQRAPTDVPDDGELFVSGERLGLVDGLSPGRSMFRSPDGRWLVYTTDQDDIWALPLDSDEPATAILAAAYPEYSPTLSPDGRWMAYVSEQTGRPEIYVRPFPDGGSATQISFEGGQEPLWGRHGSEIFYRSLESQMVAVQVSVEPTFSVESQTALFSTGSLPEYLLSGEGEYLVTGNRMPLYDVTQDGQRFLMVRPLNFKPYEMVRVENFLEIVKAAFAVGATPSGD